MDLTQSEALAVGGILGGIFASLGIVMLVIYLLLVIAQWKIFTKAGEAGWKSLIPFYNFYILFKIAGVKQFFAYTIIAAVVYSILSTVLANVEIANTIVSIIYLLFLLYIDVFSNYKLATSFGKGKGFTVGLLLLPNIFTLILGFGSAEYVGNED